MAKKRYNFQKKKKRSSRRASPKKARRRKSSFEKPSLKRLAYQGVAGAGYGAVRAVSSYAVRRFVVPNVPPAMQPYADWIDEAAAIGLSVVGASMKNKTIRKVGNTGLAFESVLLGTRAVNTIMRKVQGQQQTAPQGGSYQ